MATLIDRENAVKLWEQIIAVAPVNDNPNDINAEKYKALRGEFVNATGWETLFEDGKWELI